MTNHRSAPTPDRSDDKFGWQRRYTSLVQEIIAEGGILPKEAGARAREAGRGEFSQRFPGEALPAFIP